MTDTLQGLQIEAFERANKAKRTFEIEQADRKVRAVADHIAARLDRLIQLADDVRREVLDANERPLHYDVGAFRHDTETIDELLGAISEASQQLDNMRAADVANDELTSEFRDRANAAVFDLGQQQRDEQDGRHDGAIPMAAGGAYL